MYQLELDVRCLGSRITRLVRVWHTRRSLGVFRISGCADYLNAGGTDGGIAPSTVDTGFSKPIYVQRYGAFVVQTCQRAEV